MQQPATQTSKAYFSQLTMLHAALLGAQLICAAALYYVNSTSPLARAEDAQNLDEIFQFMVPVLVLASYMGSSILFKTKLKELRVKPDLKDKLSGYSSLLLIRYAFLEVPSLFSIVCFVLTNNILYLGLAALVMLVFLISRPTRDRAVSDLELSPAERTVLETDGAVIR